MATANYMAGRKKYGRPQAMLLANNPGTIIDGKITPLGNEFEDFIILSDDNRGELNFKINRLEQKERMINGRMRSYHIADKLSVGVQWDNLPSRSYASLPEFSIEGKSLLNSDTGIRIFTDDGWATVDRQYFTTDGGAGGVELLDWYNNNQGSFWLYLAYDNYANFNTGIYSRLSQYNEVVEVFFEDFTYSVIKRGSGTHDYWNVSMDLEEV